MAGKATKAVNSKAGGSRRRTTAATTRRGKRSSTNSLGREIWLTSWGIIGILAGLLFTGLCVGFWYGSGEIVKIIAEINERDFTVMTERERVYEEFFSIRDDQGYRISKAEKKILLGVVTYMWRVQPPGSSEIREFCWEHDLESNTVRQTTNGALLLDLRLDLISEEAARTHQPSIPKERYNPDDNIAVGIVNGDLAKITQGNLAHGWDDGSTVDRGVLPPLIPPEQANNRKALQEEEIATAAGLLDENEEPVEPSGDVVEITPVEAE